MVPRRRCLVRITTQSAMVKSTVCGARSISLSLSLSVCVCISISLSSPCVSVCGRPSLSTPHDSSKQNESTNGVKEKMTEFCRGRKRRFWKWTESKATKQERMRRQASQTSSPVWFVRPPIHPHVRPSACPSVRCSSSRTAKSPKNRKGDKRSTRPASWVVAAQSENELQSVLHAEKGFIFRVVSEVNSPDCQDTFSQCQGKTDTITVIRCHLLLVMFWHAYKGSGTIFCKRSCRPLYLCLNVFVRWGVRSIVCHTMES